MIGYEYLLFVVLLLVITNVIAVVYAVKFGLVILRLEDVIESSIDDLEKCYDSLVKISNKPVFFDSLEIRQCIAEIRKSHGIVRNIASSLTSINENNEEGITIEESWKKESINNAQEEKV
jgi:hypothetical protein